MRGSSILVASLALSACFSKPPNNTGGDGDGGVDSPPVDGPEIDPRAPALIATGTEHGCRINAGQVLCWGSNLHGQLGMRVDVPEFSGNPGQAWPGTDWQSIATGEEHSCGVRAGAVYCWGDNTDGQSDPHGSHNSNIPIARVDLPGAGVAERVFAGGNATCALTTTRDAYCWGDIELDGSSSPPDPRPLGATGDTFNLIALADDHACAIADGGGGTPGVVHCWGYANHFQTGRDNVRRTFAELAPITNTDLFTSLAAGHQATCGTTTEGKLVCWGNADDGQLAATAQGTAGYLPLVIDAGPGWTAAAVGDLHTCAVRDGDVYCFGEDMAGALGDGKFSQRVMLPSTKVAVGMKVSQLAANAGFTCALSSDGATEKCWGNNSKGELGNKKYARKLDPAEVEFTLAAQQIVAGDNHTCALVGASLPAPAYCWGLNSERQIGSSSNQILHAAPEIVGGSYTFYELAAGGLHTCGITSNRAVMACWGDNISHQLGTTNGANMTTVMAPAPAGTTWRSVAAGSRMSCGITDTDRLFCWGLRAGTTNAIGPAIEYTPPVTGHLWKSISIGSDFAVAVAAASGVPRIYSFAISSKLCAANLPSTQLNPQIPDEILTGLFPSSMEFPTVAAAQHNGSHTCLLRHGVSSSTPALTCFGVDQDGRTGGATQCDTGPGTSLRDVMLPDTGTTWSNPTLAIPAIFTASDHSCALSADEHLWCWGANNNSVLGRASSGATPQPVNDNQRWIGIAGGFAHTCGIEVGGKVFCWGENPYGQVGDDTSYEPLPVVSGVR